MYTGKRVTASVGHHVNQSWIYLTICDAATCSRVGVYGQTPDGALHYESKIDCNRMGTYDCTDSGKVRFGARRAEAKVGAANSVLRLMKSVTRPFSEVRHTEFTEF